MTARLWRALVAWLLPPSATRDEERQRAFSLLLAISIVFSASVVVFNLGAKLLLGKDGLLYLVSSLISSLIMLVLFLFNRVSFRPGVAAVYALVLVLGVTLSFRLSVLERVFVVYVLAVFVGAFLVAPPVAFHMAGLSSLAYSLAYLAADRPEMPYNYLSVLMLWVGAFFAWLIAWRLEVAVRGAAETQMNYLTLVEHNPGIDYMVEGGHLGRWLYVSARITGLLGFSPADWLSRPSAWLSALHPEDRQAVLEEETRCRDANLPFEAEYRLVGKDGQVVWVTDYTMIVPGFAGRSQGVMLDVTQRKRAEQIRSATYRISQAAYTAERLEDLYASIHKILGELIPAKNFYIALYDKENDLLHFPYFVDEHDEPPAPIHPAKTLTGYVLKSGRPLFASPPIYEEMARQGVVLSQGKPSLDWLGVPLWVNNRPIGVMVVQSYVEGQRFDQDALNILTFISAQVAMAIERRRAEQRLMDALKEKEVLLREVYHRVKNNLQVILGLLSLQEEATQDASVKNVLDDTKARISSMALVHQQLYQAQDLSRIDLGQYLQELALQVHHAAMQGTAVRLVREIEPAFVSVDRAIPCGLIVNELISNALKYAFPDGRTGTVWVRLHRQESAWRLCVQDDGVGLPQEVDIRNPQTLGLQIVDILVKQLRGRLTLLPGPGAGFEICFPD